MALDCKKIYFSIPKEITKIQQNKAAAKQAIDEIKGLAKNASQKAEIANNSARVAFDAKGAYESRISRSAHPNRSLRKSSEKNSKKEADRNDIRNSPEGVFYFTAPITCRDLY
jgi:hypothetical protein